MSILHCNMEQRVETDMNMPNKLNDRYSRDALGDLKHGLDLIFKLKSELDIMHPIAAESLIRMLTY